MAEEDKSQKLVETYKAVAAGLASVAAAVFTSRLGVAGTLIGTALTAVVITIGSAILKAQLMKATDTISGLPSAVQGRLSVQQARVPGKPSVEPNPEPGADKGGKLSNLLSRLRAMPGFLRDLPSNQRRKVLLAGILAGLVATVIGLGGVTGIELAGGNTLSCLVWSCPDDSDSESSTGSSRRSGLSIFGGSSVTGPPGADTPVTSPVAPPSGEQSPLPERDQPFPQEQQPGEPVVPEQSPEDSPPVAPQPSDEAPKGSDPSPQPGAGEQPAPDKKSETKTPPSGDQQSLRESTKSGTEA